jgi:ABC-type enterochelin transport system permease subunit
MISSSSLAVETTKWREHMPVLVVPFLIGIPVLVGGSYLVYTIFK